MLVYILLLLLLLYIDYYNNYTNTTECKINSDIVFVVDASNSISAQDLEETKTMIRNFTNELATEEGSNRIGVIVVRTYAEVHLSLGEEVTNENKNAILDRIEQIEYIPNHLTNTADGLCKLSEQPWRENASNVIYRWPSSLVMGDQTMNLITLINVGEILTVCLTTYTPIIHISLCLVLGLEVT